MGLEDKLGREEGFQIPSGTILVSALFCSRSADSLISHARASYVVSQIGRYFICVFQGSKRMLRDALVVVPLNLAFISKIWFIVLSGKFLGFFYLNRAVRRWKKVDCCIIMKWRWEEGGGNLGSSRWQGECGEAACSKVRFPIYYWFLLISPHSNILDDFWFHLFKSA